MRLIGDNVCAGPGEKFKLVDAYLLFTGFRGNKNPGLEPPNANHLGV